MSADTDAIKNMLGIVPEPAEVLLARMDERLRSLTQKVDRLADSIDKSKTPWWHWWAPLAFILASTGWAYDKIEGQIQMLERADERSNEQRLEMRRRIDRLEVAVIEGAKR